uniref:Nuclear pore complex protein n=1 Tax=Macrostomum lignano TaxID=282301 RepID=A0A1I8FMW5_9PLAT
DGRALRKIAQDAASGSKEDIQLLDTITNTSWTVLQDVHVQQYIAINFISPQLSIAHSQVHIKDERSLPFDFARLLLPAPWGMLHLHKSPFISDPVKVFELAYPLATDGNPLRESIKPRFAKTLAYVERYLKDHCADSGLTDEDAAGYSGLHTYWRQVCSLQLLARKRLAELRLLMDPQQQQTQQHQGRGQRTADHHRNHTEENIVMETKQRILEILHYILNVRLDYRITYLLSVFKSEFDTLYTGNDSDGFGLCYRNPTSQNLDVEAIAAQAEDMFCEGSDSGHALDLDGQGGRLFLRVLLYLIMHNHAQVVSGALQLLFRHFSQRQEVLQAFRQVQLLVSASDVSTYKQIRTDLDEIRMLVEKSELWVYKSRIPAAAQVAAVVALETTPLASSTTSHPRPQRPRLPPPPAQQPQPTKLQPGNRAIDLDLGPEIDDNSRRELCYNEGDFATAGQRPCCTSSWTRFFTNGINEAETCTAIFRDNKRLCLEVPDRLIQHFVRAIEIARSSRGLFAVSADSGQVKDAYVHFLNHCYIDTRSEMKEIYTSAHMWTLFDNFLVDMALVCSSTHDRAHADKALEHYVTETVTSVATGCPAAGSGRVEKAIRALFDIAKNRAVAIPVDLESLVSALMQKTDLVLKQAQTWLRIAQEELSNRMMQRSAEQTNRDRTRVIVSKWQSVVQLLEQSAQASVQSRVLRASRRPQELRARGFISRLIKHTEPLLEDKEENLCIKAFLDTKAPPLSRGHHHQAPPNSEIFLEAVNWASPCWKAATPSVQGLVLANASARPPWLRERDRSEKFVKLFHDLLSKAMACVRISSSSLASSAASSDVSKPARPDDRSGGAAFAASSDDPDAEHHRQRLLTELSPEFKTELDDAALATSKAMHFIKHKIKNEDDRETTLRLGLLGLYINESQCGLVNQALISLTEYCQGPCQWNRV